MNQIDKYSYDVELQPFYTIPGRLLAKLLTNNFGIRLHQFLEGFLKGKLIKELDCEQKFIASKSSDGHEVRLRIFRPKNATRKLPAMLYIHGGGYMVGNPEIFLSTILQYVEKRQVVIIAPDYRKSPKYPYPAGFNDCFDSLLWLKENADQLGVFSDQFIVGGHSSGGGLTAAIALKARDTKSVKIAFQMPIYPMIDYRQITSSSINMSNAPMWDSNNTKFAWSLYLKSIIENNQPVPVYASPALNTDFKDLPPTISFVGNLEPFVDETINYIDALKQAGVPVKFRVFEGAFHGFDLLATKTNIAKEAAKFHLDAFAEYYDEFFPKDYKSM